MSNKIDNPSYSTFKNAVNNGWLYGRDRTINDICEYFKVSPSIASAWLTRYEQEKFYRRR